MSRAEPTWFIADTHFYHRGILKHTDRPWVSVEEMNAGLIEAWNDTVGEDDVIWHLGDFSFSGKEKSIDILQKLNGVKKLVPGNHDDRPHRMELQESRLWDQVVDQLHEINVDGLSIVLCHYPMLTWNRAHHGALHFHGHSHGGIPQSSTRFDVGVDAVLGWRPSHRLGAPVSLAQILEVIEDRGICYEPIDHHQ